jgi:signal peptidase I
LAGQGFKSLWKNEYFRTIVTILAVIVIVIGFWYGLRWGLNTNYPILAVASGSMSVSQPDPGWASPFARTLHTGDLILVEGVSDASDIHPGPPPNGTILVFHDYQTDELIVHRAINETTIDGTLYFITQGDGNSVPGPPDYPNLPAGAVPIQDVVGKVVMRVPWLGYVALDMRNSTAVLVVVILIIAFIIVESVASEVQHKKTDKNGNMPTQSVPEPESTP